MSKVLERFLKYVKVSTTSDNTSNTYPSTKYQLSFGKSLADELKKIGMQDISRDDYGYVIAFLSANVNGNYPSIAFIAHMDTSPEESGTNVNPIITENYSGDIIQLDGISLDPKEFPSLLDHIGDDIISADGTTLLGADDKAGIAEIMTAMEYIIENDIPHGNICVTFTPDEEIGKGVKFLHVPKLKSDFGYTIDGGPIGELQYENFNAASASISIKGKSVHPGSANGIMINSLLVANEIISMMPETETPSKTSNYEGFYHLIDMNGSVSNTNLSFIIRDFGSQSFKNRKSFLYGLIDKTNKKYGKIATIKIEDQYKNMKEVIEKDMSIIELAKNAMIECGVEPLICPIRGGTDGANLSFKGLPCPNIFAGGYNFHGPYEFIPLKSMEKAVEVIVKIAQNAIKDK